MHETFMREAIALSVANVESGGGGPFAAVIVKNGVVVARGANRVTESNDPTAHAEVVAIRAACQALGVFHLAGCEIYTTCEPCPMCLAAIFWARISRFYYANTREDAAGIGFDDSLIYEQMDKQPAERSVPGTRMLADEASEAFRAWARSPNKVPY